MSSINPGVVDRTPTVAKLLTVEPVLEPADSVQHISVPLAILDKVLIFMPPGCNYSVGVAIGFNGKKFIPTEDPDDFVYGSGFDHYYSGGWQVQSQVDVFFRQRNYIRHRIYVALYLDRRPTEKQSGPGLIVPS